MRVGLVCLVLAYALSQFYRAFLAVLSPGLRADIGAMPEDLAFASALWFLIFAAMQIPVGAALDRIGPRRTTVALFALGAGGGAAVFAMAQTPFHVTLAMALIGVGCSPVLMASYYIFARIYPPAVFATLAGAVIGFGSLGNIAGSAPLAWAVEAFGWRATLWSMSGLTVAVAGLLWVTVTDPPRVISDQKGSVLNLLRMPALWGILLIMFVNYAAAAGMRGFWAGPYLADAHGADAALIGQVTLFMGLAMIAGSFAYGPLERLFGSRKWVIFGGNLLGAISCLALWQVSGQDIWTSAVLLAAIGFFGASFPLIVAHARAFFPQHLTGRGVTLVNLFGIGGVGVMQFVTGPLYRYGEATNATPGGAYGILFLFFGLILLVGLAAYLFAPDRTD
jgi:MFS family permease